MDVFFLCLRTYLVWIWMSPRRYLVVGTDEYTELVTTFRSPRSNMGIMNLYGLTCFPSPEVPWGAGAVRQSALLGHCMESCWARVWHLGPRGSYGMVYTRLLWKVKDVWSGNFSLMKESLTRPKFWRTSGDELWGHPGPRRFRNEEVIRRGGGHKSHSKGGRAYVHLIQACSTNDRCYSGTTREVELEEEIAGQGQTTRWTWPI